MSAMLTKRPAAVTAYPEPAIPAGMKATPWVQWVDIATIAHLLGINEFGKSDSLDVHARLQKAIAAGVAQNWKPKGPGRGKPSYFRMIGVW